MIEIQFVDNENASWPLVKWPAVPRQGDFVELVDENDELKQFTVETVSWSDSYGCLVVVIELKETT